MRSLVIVCVLLASAAGVGLADDWPHWRGPNGDGHSAEKGLLKSWSDGGPERLWSTSGLGQGWSAATIADGRVYVTGMEGGEGQLHCFDTAGKRLWQKGYGKEWNDGSNYPGARCTPTVDEGRVFVMSAYGVISCWDAKTGKKAWSVDTFARFGGQNIKWAISESPLIYKSAVIVTPGGKNASVVALNKKTGKTIWTSRGLSERSAYASPVLIKRGRATLLMTMLEKSIVCMNPRNGATIWKVGNKNQYSVHPNPPVLSRTGLLVCSSGYGYGSIGLQISASGGYRKVWQKKILDTHHGGAVMIGNYVFGTSTNRPKSRLLCVDARNGNVVKESQVIGKGSVITAEGRLYCYGESGKVALVDPNGLEELGSFDVDEGGGQHWAHPSISDGRLYIRHGGALMVYSIKKK